MDKQKLTLTFLSEQTGVTLRVAKYNRGFILNSDEYLLYSSLFNVADTSNTSSLSSGAFVSLLHCTSLHRMTIESLVTFIQTASDVFNDSTALTLEDWLVVCKLIECLQCDMETIVVHNNHNDVNGINDSTNAPSSIKKKSKDKKGKEKDKNRDLSGIEPSLSSKDSRISRGLSVLDVNKCFEELLIGGHTADTVGRNSQGSSNSRSSDNSVSNSSIHSRIESRERRKYANFWRQDRMYKRKDEHDDDDTAAIYIGSMGREKVVENELRSHYTYKFKCKTDSCKYASKEWTIIRRFSDFDVLCTIILRQSHLGAVLPPLPPKFFSTDEKVASQREVDLLLFLREAVKYPVLAYSYEFKAFLEASPSGMDALRQFYEKDYRRLISFPPIDYDDNGSSNKIDNCTIADSHSNVSSGTGYKEGRKDGDVVETIVFANGISDNSTRGGGQQCIDDGPPSPQSEASSSSSLSTSSTASASIVSRASYWAGEASQMMGSLYLMASDSVEALSKTASVQAATRTVVGAKGAMMNKIYGQHGNEADELTNFDIFGPLMGTQEPTDGGYRRYAWDPDEPTGALFGESKNRDNFSDEQRIELGIKAITRTNRLSRLSSKADSLLECERLVCKAHGELSAEFMKLSDLEGNSNMGHVSASFDSSSYGKSLQAYATSRGLTITQEFHHIFGSIRLLARYRESIRSAIAHREGYKNQLKFRLSHVRDAKIKSAKATKYAKDLAETFAAQSNNKSPMKISVTDNVDPTRAVTVSEISNDVQNNKNCMQSDDTTGNDISSSSHPQSLSLSTNTLMSFVNMVRDKIVGENDSSTPLSANQVFNAQASSAKAIKDLEKEEMSLHCLRKEANLLQTRMESDLVFLEQEQRRELQKKLVEFVKIRMVASKSSAKIWEDFGSRLESFGGDSLAHGTIDKFL